MTLGDFGGIGLIVFGYLTGSIPTGILVGNGLFGVNLLQRGSGNMGATNALRSIGVGAAVVVLIGDFFKGVLVAAITGIVLPDQPFVQAAASMAAVIGHTRPIFTNFRGGRGVATGMGAAAVIYPIVIAVGIPVGIMLVIFLRYVSLGSIIGTVTGVLVGLILYITGYPSRVEDTIFVVLAGTLIVWQHLPNLKRLIAGKELQIAEWSSYFRN
tara:strand:+ start:585 stop:1223 length:639 start_codon:yes stop_codon:yes gene_type:complete